MGIGLDIKNEVRRSDIFSHLTSMDYLPRWVVLVIDVFICLASFFIADAVAQELYYYKHDVDVNSVALTMFFLLLSQSIWFWIFHSYSGVIRYTAYVDLAKVGLAVLCNVFFILLLNYVLGHILGKSLFLKATIFIYGVIAYLLLMLFRIAVKTIYSEIIITSRNKELVVVFGTKTAGISIAQMLINSADNKYYFKGFISNEKYISSKRILGKPIYSMSDRNKLLEDLSKHRINTVIVSPIIMKEAKTEDFNWFIDNGLKVLKLPLMKDWKDDEILKNIDLEHNLRKMQIEDLLGRAPIKLDDTHISESLNSKVIMISGAAGSIGSEIARQVITFSPKLLILLDNAETALNDLKLELAEFSNGVIFACVIADVRYTKRIDQLFAEYKPNYVYHAAAYKHVPMMEDYPSECVLANVLGTQNIANCAVKYGVEKFVMISTDKAVNPTNVMGASKRIAEIYVQSYFNSLKTQHDKPIKFITTRFGNVLGSNGSVIPLFRKQIEARGPITVTHPEIIRYFMTIPEACQLVLEAGVMGRGGEIFVFDMGEPVKIVDLAKKMVSMSGLKLNTDINIEFTGLRPGEKLYEELLNTQETTLPTTHEKIMIAKVRECDFKEVKDLVDSLICLAKKSQDYLVVEKMKMIVPEYKSKNSCYEKIDMEIQIKNNYGAHK